jgi:hypothetical protein
MAALAAPHKRREVEFGRFSYASSGAARVGSGSATHGQLLDAVCKGLQAVSYHRNQA